MPTLPAFALEKDLRQAIRNGHPWVFDRALARSRPAVTAGQLVQIRHGRDVLALAYADPGRPIAARILDLDPHATIDAAWVAGRARAAARCRAHDPRLSHTNAMRLIHGENDYLPGLVVDLYDDTAVVTFDGPGAFACWAPRFAAVVDGIRSSGVTVNHLWARAVRSDKKRGKRGKPAKKSQRSGHGNPSGNPSDAPAVALQRAELAEPPALISVHEYEARFLVDVRKGHKTGLFLDQRDNRRLVGQMSAGARVLDICSYVGTFSVHAALGGASQVTAVDIAAPAMDAARANFAASELDADAHRFVVADAFAFLEAERERGARYNVVVVDPPSFAPSERARASALEAYRRLDELALGVVMPGGWLMTASCSSHVTLDDSLRVLRDASRRSGRRVRITERRGAGSDHPTLPGFPEGSYLDFLVVAVA